MRKLFAILNGLLVFLIINSHIDLSAQVNNEITIGHSIKLESKILEESRLIQIYLPQTYDNNIYKYPVLYLTDGEDNFENAVSIIKTKSNYYQNMPEMIIVAIGSGSNRNKNFTFTDGSAEKTMEFIKNELIPIIDDKYRTENYRVLFGHSLAGPFVFYTLAKEPDLFDAILTLSPGMHHVLSKPAKPALIEYLNRKKLKNKRIYVGAAEKDPKKLLESFYMLDSLFNNSNLKTIQYKFELTENEDHWSIPLIGMYKGLQYLFQDWKIPLAVPENVDTQLLRSHIDKLSSQYGYDVKYPEFLLNFIAMEFLEPEGQHDATVEKMQTSAKEIFEINLKNYPTSANANFYLGIYYLYINDKELASKQFRKCLELDPKHEMAQQQLTQLNKAETD